MVEPSSDRNIRIEKSAVGSAIVSGDGNTIYVIHQGIEPQDEPTDKTEGDVAIGPNPYKGLAAFQAKDAANYFGREAQVERLWQRFQDLYEQSGRPDSKPRFLPILGPSGCGKSSLARAGLVPELARRPLPGKEKMRVVVMVPGASPVKSLAGVLAKLTQDDKTPEVIKKRRYEEELRKSAASGRFDFWQDVAETLLDVQSVPVVVLVDQFEEVYSLCEDAAEREAFIENLLYAARSATGYVSVVVTLRSDFLGETQRHKVLNQLIGSDLSMIVPAMTEEELRRAIALPAKQAGYPLDEATVDLLVNDAEGREGALPLLQFALTRIWEGLRVGKSPSETYREMNGVGGALAQKAQDIYDSLSVNEQEIARRVFLGLVQLGEGVRDTRRRTAVENLATSRDTPDVVKEVVCRFSAPGARLVSLSSEASKETAEVTHEALFDHWQLLNDWLDSSREDIRFQRRLEEDAVYWDEQGRPNGLLWRSPDLDLLRKFEKKSQGEMSSLSCEFFEASDTAEKREKRLKRLGVTGLAAGLLISTTLSLFATYKVHQAARRQMELYEARARDLADSDDLESLINGLAAIGLGRSPLVKFPRPFREPLVTTAILDEPNRAIKASYIFSNSASNQKSAVSADGSVIAVISGSRSPRAVESTLQIRNALGQLTSAPIKALPGPTVLAISADGSTIVCGNADGLIQMWDRSGKPLSEAYKGHSKPVRAISISAGGKSILSTDFEGNSNLWNREGTLIGEVFDGSSRPILRADGRVIIDTNSSARESSDFAQFRIFDVTENKAVTQPPKQTNLAIISSLAMSVDGNTIAASSVDGKVQLFDSEGQSISEPFTVGPTNSLHITKDGQLILTVSIGVAKLWNRQGDLIETIGGNSSFVVDASITSDGKTIVFNTNSIDFEGINDEGSGTFRIWDRSDDLLFRSFEDTSYQSLSVAISEDGKTVAILSSDKMMELLDEKGDTIGKPFKLPSDVRYSGKVNRYTPTVSLTDDAFITVVDDNQVVWRFDQRGNVVDKVFSESEGGRISTLVSADGKTIVSNIFSDALKIFNSKGSVVEEYPELPEGNIEMQSASADGQTILVAERTERNKGTVKLIDRKTQTVRDLFENPNMFSAIASMRSSYALLSADGQTIASRKDELLGTTESGSNSSSRNRAPFRIEYSELQLWDSEGTPIGESFAKTKNGFSSFAINDTGTLVVVGYNDGTIQLWDRDGNTVGRPLEGHSLAIASLAFSLDGKSILSSSHDGTVSVWPVWLSEGWVSYTCDRLANYLPEASKTSDVAREAKQTCDRYAWK
ncbi:MAG: hypothetical protein AAGN15_23455 [Cyanobacteria bacterium J06581_3]